MERHELETRVKHLEDILRKITVLLAEADIAPPPDLSLTQSDRLMLPCNLPPRVSEVVRCLLAGYRVPTIARLLGVSPHTVRNHLKLAFRRLGVRSQQELIERLRSWEVEEHEATKASLQEEKTRLVDHNEASE
ncbi:MAG: helix-turn-helix transcriptional regulator [Candidatus Binatia bacterium]